MVLKLHLKKGALHKDLGIASGKKIPLSAEKKAVKSNSPLKRKRAQFAINARKWHHEEVETFREDREHDLKKRIDKANKNLRQLGHKGAWFDDKVHRRFDRNPPSTYSVDGYKSHLDSHKAGWRIVRDKSKAELKNRSKQGSLQFESVKSLTEISKKMLTRYVNASHESSLDDIKKFPDRLEGEKRALDRLQGKYKSRQTNGQMKRINYRMSAEDVDNMFENWNPIDSVLNTVEQFLLDEGLGSFLFGNVDRSSKTVTKVQSQPRKRRTSDPDPADSIKKGPYRNPKTGRIAPQNWGISRNTDEDAVDAKRNAADTNRAKRINALHDAARKKFAKEAPINKANLNRSLAKDPARAELFDIKSKIASGKFKKPAWMKESK